MPKKIVLGAKTNKVFNPLTELASSGGLFKSESAVQNMLVGVCPKCGKSMGTSTISSGDAVYWCGTCCVASPLLDS